MFSVTAEQTEYGQLMMWLFICGFFRGMALSNFTLTVSEYCSLEQLPAAFGWHMVGKGIFVTFLGPFIGNLLLFFFFNGKIFLLKKLKIFFNFRINSRSNWKLSNMHSRTNRLHWTLLHSMDD